MFGVSLYGMQFVEQQFFPSSDRNELLVDFTLPQNASIAETKAQMDRFEAKLAGDPDIDHWSSYVGQGAVRFILSFDPQPSNPNYGQMVIVTKSIEARERLRAKIKALARQEFAGLDVYVDLLAVGPPAGRPVQYRLSGPDVQKVRELAQQLASSRRRAPPGQQHRLQLERAGARGEGRRAPGQGPPARRDLAGHRRRPQRRRGRHEHHPGARRDLSGRRGGPGAAPPSGSRSRRSRTCNCRARMASPCRWRRSRPSITSSSSR